MIVVDLGAAPCEACDSISLLVERFHPNFLFAFDPRLSEGVYNLDTTVVLPYQTAAWLEGGQVSFVPDGVASTLRIDGCGPLLHESMWLDPQPEQIVKCFDFSAWLLRLGEQVTLKVDIEGAELVLLSDMLRTGADKRVDLLLLEWHVATPAQRTEQDRILGLLSCPVEDWAN